MSSDAVVKVSSMLKPIVPGFLEKKKEELPEITIALASKDFTKIRTIGHGIKGSGGGYGFPQITEFGSQIEQGAIAQDESKIKEAVEQMKVYLETVKVEFED